MPLPAVFYGRQQIAKVNLTCFSFLFAVGLYYCFSNLSDARIFIIMYGVTSMYFSAVMVRAAACRAQAGRRNGLNKADLIYFSELADDGPSTSSRLETFTRLFSLP